MFKYHKDMLPPLADIIGLRCDMPGCHEYSLALWPDIRPTYVYDHCHTHGWVRGIICNPCNRALTYADKGIARDRYKLLTLSWPVEKRYVIVSARTYSDYLSNCPECIF